jgi:hypothetical protein
MSYLMAIHLRYKLKWVVISQMYYLMAIVKANSDAMFNLGLYYDEQNG